ncbi:heat-inducible transcriptional repressor HrcA [Zhaonella formicivorans]|uniref:heat-inducible transcriptional repressor HrcA n=1 Tax=Zhaonella formicivorans TaxID=2528593 RepID=UPI0010DAF57C|nr:heat-inducible transcriptional repressor HrcA [Zhaonella formicivorans]
MPMDERKKKVLQAIIQDYIATAEPVGSRTIARKYDLGVSPATIRNEMADLEELGYIEQPHTSAGRIPSDLGYRYYVDCLMEKENLNQAEEEYIRYRFSQKMEEIEAVIRQASEVLSEMTNYTALILGPQLGRRTFSQIRLMPLSPGSALMIVVSNSRLVQHRILDIPESITPADLERISLVLNDRLQGFALEQVKRDTLYDIYGELASYKNLVSHVLDVIEQLACSKLNDKVYLGGTLNIFNQPEFKDIDKLKSLLGVLEKESVLKDLMEVKPELGLTIRIGGENKYEEINGCSLITATYQVDGVVLGTLGILGPTRMAYSKAVSLVECVTENLSQVLAKLLK